MTNGDECHSMKVEQLDRFGSFDRSDRYSSGLNGGSMAAKKTGGDFAANQRQLNEEIAKGDFRRVYLLCGEQAYLRLQNKDKLTKALLGDGDAMNLSRYSGASVTALEVIEMAQTLPFFADRRVIVLENTGMLNPKAAAKSVTGSRSSASISEEAEKLAGFIPDIPDTASVVFVEENVDKRGKLYKAILKSRKDELGEILECTTPDEADLRAWTSGIFRRSGLSVNGRTLALFLSYTGEDMQNIAAEAEKLCCYCMGKKEITEQDIRDVCSPRIKDRIFDMIEAIAMRDRKKALEIYMELCALRTAPQVILMLMRRQFEQLIKIRELSGKAADSEIARQVGLPPFVVTKKYKPALKMYTSEALLSALEECVAADHESKSGRIDAGIAVEMIIVKHSGRV